MSEYSRPDQHGIEQSHAHVADPRDHVGHEHREGPVVRLQAQLSKNNRLTSLNTCILRENENLYVVAFIRGITLAEKC